MPSRTSSLANQHGLFALCRVSVSTYPHASHVALFFDLSAPIDTEQKEKGRDPAKWRVRPIAQSPLLFLLFSLSL